MTSYRTKQEEKRLKFALNITKTTSYEDLGINQYLNRNNSLYIYGGLILGLIIFSNVKNILFCQITLTSSQNIHNDMFTHLVRTPIQFFNANPSGI